MIRRIPGYRPNQHYEVAGKYDPERKALYFNMTTAVEFYFQVMDR